ncbi:hypothetical protein KDK95_05430 [Actinospica sp. MGRD01-02]|uniref:Glycosyl hydrolase n=1 Tax=Actinospica acidithermotolerans TaxID=2828514 RepID=A0A941E3X3_9ACTN|nr:hypothetical protein [Actinospica acidithermotolerans]MBR7825740.1 hypothetical protein [Actinospica acidithermotolerans]
MSAVVLAATGGAVLGLIQPAPTVHGCHGTYAVSLPASPSTFALDATSCTSVVSAGSATTSAPPAFPTAPPLTADGHLFESSQRFAQFQTGGYAMSNDEWGTGYNTQTLWVNSSQNWGIHATQPDTPDVKSYANIGVNLHTSLDSLTSVTSSFNETNPVGGSWESAYDLWLDGTGIEVMAWTYESGGVQPLGQPVGTVTLGGSTWTLFVGNNGHNPTYSFVREGNENSGTVDLLSLLKYLEKAGYFSNPVLSSIQYGWEITGTGDVEKDFTMNEYSAAIGTS